MKLLGIDYGSKKIGLAISDVNGLFSFPYAVISNNEKTINKIRNICQKEQIKKIIIGLSVNYEGGENPLMKKSKIFANKLITELSLPLDWENEILTTQEAKRFFSNKDPSLDARAASLILKSYIDRLSTENS